MLRSFTVLVWLAFFVCSVWQFGERQFVLGGLGMFAGITAIPLIALENPWQERVMYSIVMAFGGLGIVAGVLLFLFLLRHSEGFRAVFNGKGTAPCGLVLFMCIFFPAGGAVGCACVRLAQRCFRER